MSSVVPAAWDEFAAGRAVCPLDYPRPESDEFRHFVRKLKASSLYLDRDQTYRGHCVLIYDLAHATRIDQLSAEQWLAHLHWHIIPRFKDDGCWGAPVWTATLAEMPRKVLAAHEYPALALKINEGIGHGK